MCLAIPGLIVEITDSQPLTKTATVAFDTLHKSVCIALVPTADVGDYIIVHAGYGLSVIDEVEAEKIFQLLESIDQQNELRQ